jgi:hypothetical protein
MNAALEQQKCDLVLADYSMPQFNAPAALEVFADIRSKKHEGPDQQNREKVNRTIGRNRSPLGWGVGNMQQATFTCSIKRIDSMQQFAI